MLVLSRSAGQEITIGDDVVVRVHEVKGGKVKLVITAPREVAVLRRELVKAIVPGDVAVIVGNEVAA
jgi:carbon storage regulator